MLKELFIKHIDENFSFLKDGNSIIAVSGGVDSMVLLHLAQATNLKIAVANCNFNLRGAESDGDSEFVKEYAKQHTIELFTTSFDTSKFAKEHKLSTQMAARELRYFWFEEIRKENNFDYILTAHHLDDNLETFLINLSRGSGIDGLLGIPAISNAIVRPLLPFGRSQILEYAQENNISWREDSSNSDDHYLRNSIRQKITPCLLFSGDTQKALIYYEDIFENSIIKFLDKNQDNHLIYADFKIDDLELVCIDVEAEENPGFAEAFTFVIKCENQIDVNYYWKRLSYESGAEEFGWLKDKFGLSWHIVPKSLDQKLMLGSLQQREAVIRETLEMKKIIIKDINTVYKESK